MLAQHSHARAFQCDQKLTILQKSRRKCVGLRAQDKHTDARDKLKQLLQDDPEIHKSLDKVREAAALVADLQAQRAAFDDEARIARNASPSDVKRQEEQQAQRAAGRGANEDVIRAADELERAKAAFTEAAAERNKWATAVDEEGERAESGKAGAISAVATAGASLPFLVARPGAPIELAASLAAVLVTGLLFGVTYRYAVRQDRNPQLKGGVIAAFGLARGCALAEDVIRGHSDAVFNVETLAAAALLCGESVITAAFAATALEVAFQRGILKPFGVISSDRL